LEPKASPHDTPYVDVNLFSELKRKLFQFLREKWFQSSVFVNASGFLLSLSLPPLKTTVWLSNHQQQQQQQQKSTAMIIITTCHNSFLLTAKFKG